MANVLLVQGTWGDDDRWWRRSDEGNTFADAVVAAGHHLIAPPGRQYEWSTDLGGIMPGNRDLNVWRGAGRYLHDHLDPPLCPFGAIEDVTIIAHSHGRGPVKFACHEGLWVPTVIFVSGPIRKDVDREAAGARENIGRLICLNGGRKDRWQWIGTLFDGRFGIERQDPEADVWETYKDADHSSLLRDPKQFHRVLQHIK